MYFSIVFLTNLFEVQPISHLLNAGNGKCSNEALANNMFVLETYHSRILSTVRVKPQRHFSSTQEKFSKLSVKLMISDQYFFGISLNSRIM